MSAALRGRKLSTDHRMKMSVARKGHPFYGKRGYTMSAESKQNIKDGIRSKRYTREYAKKLSDTKLGEVNPQSKLSGDKVIAIRQLYDEGYTQQKLGDMFGVKRSTIQDVVQRKTWKHI